MVRRNQDVAADEQTQGAQVVETSQKVESLKEKLRALHDQALVGAAQSMIDEIMSRRDTTARDVLQLLQDESLAPFLDSLNFSSAEVAVPKRRGRPPLRAVSAAASERAPVKRGPGRPKKAATSEGRKLSPRQPARGKDGRAQHYAATLEIIQSAGDQGIRKKELIEVLNQRVPAFKRRQWMIAHSIKALCGDKEIKVQKEGREAIYIARA